jgi:copper chaperone CopZ
MLRDGRGAGAGTAGRPSRVTVRFPVARLDCTECGGNLRAAMRTVPGVQAVAPNVSAQEVAVTFDPGRISPAAVRARLDALGLGRH